MKKILMLVMLATGNGMAQDFSQAIQGKEGWLFLTEELSPPEQNLTNINYMVVQQMQQLLKSRKINLYISLVPRKASIYKEFLNEDQKLAASKQDNYSTIVMELKKRGISVIDLRPSLNNLKALRTPAYLKTDTHWSPAGAFAAGNTVAEQIKSSLPADLPTIQYSVSNHNVQGYHGDLIKLLPQAVQSSVRLDEFTSPTFDRTDQAGLLDDNTPGITLIGTSYSEDGVFGKSIAKSLKMDVLDVSLPGKGFIEPFVKYFSSDNFKLHAPKAIIWEIPERLFSRNSFEQNALEYLQLAANILGPSGNCKSIPGISVWTKSGDQQSGTLPIPAVNWKQYVSILAESDSESSLEAHLSNGEVSIEHEGQENIQINLPAMYDAQQVALLASRALPALKGFVCNYPEQIIDTITDWKSIDLTSQRLAIPFRVRGLNEAIESGQARAGFGPETRIDFWSKTSGLFQVSIKLESGIPGETPQIRLNGVPVATLTNPGMNITQLTFTTAMRVGMNSLQVVYNDWSGKTKTYYSNDPRPVAVRFFSLNISRK